MRANSKRISLAVGWAAALGAAPSVAQQQSAPAQQQTAPSAQQQLEESFNSVAAAGFKVVATSFVPALQPTTQAPGQIIVTLQKDRAFAVCTMAAGSWENLATAPTLDDPKICDVRFY